MQSARSRFVAKETEQLFDAVPAGSPAAANLREQLVLTNLGLADSVARRYTGRGIERDDLIQVARLGLAKAAWRYEAALGVPFAGFAVPTILGELKRHFRDAGWMVRPPRALQDLGAALRGSSNLTGHAGLLDLT
ncbi:MAG: hypothetical protein M3140_11665 [Actinomycetota bacterium]|nr:hypothetical protein [Actinomycetota bacterium]